MTLSFLNEQDQGVIDEVCIYDRLLPDEEITYLVKNKYPDCFIRVQSAATLSLIFFAFLGNLIAPNATN